MDPHQIIVLRGFQDLVGELPVDPLVGFPILVIVMYILGEVMEQRPDGLVAESEIEAIQIFFRKMKRYIIHRFQLLLNLFFGSFAGLPQGKARPSNPDIIILFGYRTHPGCQTPGTRDYPDFLS